MLDQLPNRKVIFVYWSIRPYLKVYEDDSVHLIDTLKVRKEIKLLNRISWSIFLYESLFDNRLIMISLDYLKNLIRVVCDNSAIIQIAKRIDLYCVNFLSKHINEVYLFAKEKTNGSLESELPFVETEVNAGDFTDHSNEIVDSWSVKVTNIIRYIQPIVIINLKQIGCKPFSLFRWEWLCVMQMKRHNL